MIKNLTWEFTCPPSWITLIKMNLNQLISMCNTVQGDRRLQKSQVKKITSIVQRHIQISHLLLNSVRYKSQQAMLILIPWIMGEGIWRTDRVENALLAGYLERWHLIFRKQVIFIITDIVLLLIKCFLG